MRKNNKGVALAYTLMIMLLVFAICAVITSITLAQVASTDRYSGNADTERISLQIGEIFCGTQNDGFTTSFESALGDNIVETTSDGWIVEYDEHQFLLVFSTDETADKLVIKNVSGTKVYLTVGVKNGQIVEWTKGTTDGQGS